MTNFEKSKIEDAVVISISQTPSWKSDPKWKTSIKEKIKNFLKK
jgi:hypothetical protein